MGVLADGSVVTAGQVDSDGLDVSSWGDVAAAAAGSVHTAPNTGRAHTVDLLRGGSVRVAVGAATGCSMESRGRRLWLAEILGLLGSSDVCRE